MPVSPVHAVAEARTRQPSFESCQRGTASEDYKRLLVTSFELLAATDVERRIDEDAESVALKALGCCYVSGPAGGSS